MTELAIRRLGLSDSLDQLTDLLHRAFAPLGRLGLNCTSVDQGADITRERIARGDCFVAVADRRVVGTVTVQGADRESAVNWYRNPAVASIHQFAVDPSHQGCGVGLALLRTAERWATSRRYPQLALDTPEPALHLRAFYARRGFMLAETTKLDGRSYFSVILSKALEPFTRCSRPVPWLPRHPAELVGLNRDAIERHHRSAPAR